MSLSATKASMDKSIQEDVRADSLPSSTMVRKSTNPTSTSVSQENRQTKESKESKTEMTDSKEKKTAHAQKESLIDSARESLKIKSVETKKETTEVKVSKVTSSNATTQTNTPVFKPIPVSSKSDSQSPSNVAVPRQSPPPLMPVLNERPLVLTTHLVPSLPIGLFQILVEAIEVATEKPVALLYEPRSDRPVAKEVADIAILPASGEWEDGELLPVTFCFEHHLNKDNLPGVYADVIAATDHAPHIKEITDLRGHRCSLPDRKKKIGAATLLFNYLYTRGESPAFFGNTLDAETQVATLQMVAGKQVEVGVLESPVIKCHKDKLPGINSLHILMSLGPLPPYRIMVRKMLPNELVQKITTYLLNMDQDKEWLDKLAPYGVTSFVKNSSELYDFGDAKSAVTSVRYY